MKFYIFFSILGLLLSGNTLADFGLISDKDGYVNLREEMSLKSKIVEKIINNEVVSCILEEENSKFCYTNLSNGKQGYIYKNRVNFFKGYSKISLSKVMSNFIIFKGDNLEIKIFYKELKVDKKELEKIGDKYYLGEEAIWGIDNIMPNNNYFQLSEIEIVFNGKVIIISSENLKGYLFPKKQLNNKNELSYFNIYLKGGELYLINQFNSGGAAAYNIYFYIKDYKLLRNKAWLEEI